MGHGLWLRCTVEQARVLNEGAMSSSVAVVGTAQSVALSTDALERVGERLVVSPFADVASTDRQAMKLNSGSE